MDRRRAAAALLALAACFACSAAAPTASDHTALELHDGPMEGCYYNFQHYGEGDRIMTNEPCLNCTCHNRMLMCYLRVCPFTKPIGQDCTVEKRADQCCPIVTCPDVPVDLLTSTSTSSPAEYGSTGVGKYDRYGCSINGKYFSEGSKVPSTPNKPCEHCYCIRNMTTCVMQECTLHVDGCTPIYHKDVCCPVRYSCDHEDEMNYLDDMSTTERPTPGFILTTTTTMAPVTQMTQDCVHDDQVFPDGALIKTEKACEHCYCMKGDIVCVVQECGTPMENEGKNCTSLLPRHGQCCPDTYICEGDDRGSDLITEIIDQSTQPPRRAGVEGSGYRNEPDEPYTVMTPFEIDTEGSGGDYDTAATIGSVEDVTTEKVSLGIGDEMPLATLDDRFIQTTEPDKGENTIPDTTSDKTSLDLHKQEKLPVPTETNVEFSTTLTEMKTTVSDKDKNVEEKIITTESAFRKEDNNMVSDEIITLTQNEKLSTLSSDLVDKTTPKDKDLFVDENTTKYSTLIDETTDLDRVTEPNIATPAIYYTSENPDDLKRKEITTETELILTTTNKNIPAEIPNIPMDHSNTVITTETSVISETTSVNPVINEVDESTMYPGRIPGEGDCLLNGITYSNNTFVPSANNCHTSCKCTSSIIKCEPIICSPPPEYMENMNDCQPIYDSPDACCPTYVCSGKETIPPQSHSQMSGTESPKPIVESECNSKECAENEDKKPVSDQTSCISGDCLHQIDEKKDQTHMPPLVQDCLDDMCQISPVLDCEGDKCEVKPIDSEPPKKMEPEIKPPILCDDENDCEKDTNKEECKDQECRRKDSSDLDKNEAETPEKHVTTTINVGTTETASLDVTKQSEVFTEFSETTKTPQITTEPHTLIEDSKRTDLPTVQVVTEKTEAEPQGVTENTKLPEQTSDKSDKLTTELSDIQATKDVVFDIIQTERVTTIKDDHDDSSKSSEVVTESNITNQPEIVTQKIEIYTELMPAITDSDSTFFELSEDKPDKSTIVDMEHIDKYTTTEKNAETYGIQDEPTTLSVIIDNVSKETELDKHPEIYEIPTSTSQPFEYTAGDLHTTESQKHKTETSETLETTHDRSTAGISEVSDRIPEMTDDKDTTNKIELTTEPNILTTEQSQFIQTEKDESSEVVTPAILTSYTEAPEYLITKVEEIHDSTKVTTEQSMQHTDSLPTTKLMLDITEKSTDKEIASTESSEQLHSHPTTGQIASNEITSEYGTPVIIKEEIFTEAPITLYTKSDELVTEMITKKQFDSTDEEEKDTTKVLETSATEKVEVYTDNPQIYTFVSDESAFNNCDVNQGSSCDQTKVHTTPGLDHVSIEDVTEKKDTLSKDSEQSITTEKVKGADERPHSTLGMEMSTANSFAHATETLNDITTESTQDKLDDHEIDKKVTTVSDTLLNQDTTTVPQEFIAITDSQTQTSLVIDDKTDKTLTDTFTQHELDSKDVDKTTQRSPEIEKTLPTSSSKSEDTTDQYTTEPQKKDTIFDVALSSIDLTTKASIDNEMNVKITTTSKIQDEPEIIVSTKTTISPQQTDDEENESSSPLVQSDILSSTIISITSLKEKEFDKLPYTTESVNNVEDQNMNNPTISVIDDKQVYITTEKSSIEEENIPLPTRDNKPEEGTTQTVILHTEEEDINTEDVKLPNKFETDNQMDTITTESLLADIGTTGTKFDERESEKTTNVPDGLIDLTEPEKDLNHEQTDEPNVTTRKPLNELEYNNSISTTSIQSNDDAIVTKTPIVTPVSEPVVELTTKNTYDETTESGEKYITSSDQYITESDLPIIKPTKDELVQKDENIVTTESSADITYSHAVETSSQEVTTGDEMKETDETSDIKTTSHYYDLQNAKGPTTVKSKETFEMDDQKTTPEIVSPDLSEYPTPVITDEAKTVTPREEISTVTPKSLDSDGFKSTEPLSVHEIELTTVYSDLHHHETLDDETKKNDAVGISESQTYTTTTESIKTILTEKNEGDNVGYPSSETDKPVEIVTESTEHKVTEVNEIPSTEISKLSSERQDFEKSDSTKESFETTESPYVTFTVHKESSTEETGLTDKITHETVTDAQKLVTPAYIDINEAKTNKSPTTNISQYPETDITIENQTQSEDKDLISIAGTTNSYDELQPLTTTAKTVVHQLEEYSTQPSETSTSKVAEQQPEEYNTQSSQITTSKAAEHQPDDYSTQSSLTTIPKAAEHQPEDNITQTSQTTTPKTGEYLPEDYSTQSSLTTTPKVAEHQPEDYNTELSLTTTPKVAEQQPEDYSTESSLATIHKAAEQQPEGYNTESSLTTTPKAPEHQPENFSTESSLAATHKPAEHQPEDYSIESSLATTLKPTEHQPEEYTTESSLTTTLKAAEHQLDTYSTESSLATTHKAAEYQPEEYSTETSQTSTHKAAEHQPEDYSTESSLTTTHKAGEHQPEAYSTQSSLEKETKEPSSKKEVESITTENIGSYPDITLSTEKHVDSNVIIDSTTSLEYKFTETTPALVELTEHTHRLVDEVTTKATGLQESTTEISESQQPERGDQIPDNMSTNKDEYETSKPIKTTAQASGDEIIKTTITPDKTKTEVIDAVTELVTDAVTDKSSISTSTYNNPEDAEKVASTVQYYTETSSPIPQIINEQTTKLSEIQQPSTSSSLPAESSTILDDSSEKPLKPEIPDERIPSEETKATTSKIVEKSSTYLPPISDNTFKPEEKPLDTKLPTSTYLPEMHKHEFTGEPTEEMPPPDIPHTGSGGYGPDDYIDEDQAFGPGTCRYGGKVYVSAQQIPRDDPCDFCFCFRSDIICLQQSCPPPIHGCHEEPIQGFCCPRYECPVSMATTLNVTTTTTTTTTTLPPHFLPHAYKGAAQRKGCQIKGHTYKVGEVVRASSGPCLHCTCGGDGQMKCDPKACTPEPMLRQMIAAAVSAKRKR